MSDKPDMVNSPPHYRNSPSGVECIQVTEHMNFCVGNAVKYLWRCGDKGDALEDLKKARWYVDREIARVEAERAKAPKEFPKVESPIIPYDKDWDPFIVLEDHYIANTYDVARADAAKQVYVRMNDGKNLMIKSTYPGDLAIVSNNIAVLEANRYLASQNGG